MQIEWFCIGSFKNIIEYSTSLYLAKYLYSSILLPAQITNIEFVIFSHHLMHNLCVRTTNPCDNSYHVSTISRWNIKSNLPFLNVRKLSSLGTYWISYTNVVLGRNSRSLFILYTAYLKASSMLLFFWSSVNIAPEEN